MGNWFPVDVGSGVAHLDQAETAIGLDLKEVAPIVRYHGGARCMLEPDSRVREAHSDGCPFSVHI